MSPDDSIAPAANSASESEALPAGLIILVAEDNQANQMVARMLLKKLGCLVLIAGDGREAIEIAKKEPLDLILMDCMMPVMDGFEATRAIRQLPAPASKLPIIAMTARSMPGDSEMCLEAGMNAVIAKPINRRILQETILDYCSERPSESSFDNPGTSPLYLAQLHPAGGFSQEALLSRMEGDRALAREMAKLFCTDMLEQLSGLESCLAAKNWPQASRMAHSLAGSAASTGAKTLARLARELENLLRREMSNVSDEGTANEQFASLRKVAQGVIEVLKNFA